MTSIIKKRESLHKQLAAQENEKSELQFQIDKIQGLANIGTVTCMIVHELNNLLTAASSYSALALQHPDDKALTEKALVRTVRNCERASKIAESMLAVANGERQEKANVRLSTLVDEIFACLCRDFAKDGITVKIEISADLAIWAVPAQIQQVLMNLILNAREAMLGSGGVLGVKASEDGDSVHIEVRDTGSGIETEKLEKIFEPFYSTKVGAKKPSQNSGFGIGLAFCKKVIDSHGGCISVESEPDNGAKFTIVLPKTKSEKL